MPSLALDVRDRLVGAWNDHLRRWILGDDSLPDSFEAWWSSYHGRGDGQPTRDAFAEPYIGDWTRARLVTLGLNPGPADLRFQGRQGWFVKQLEELGAYSSWAATDPYGGEPWEAAHGPNRYRRARLRFARDWLEHDQVAPAEVLMVELYPWHSNRVNSPIEPPPEVLAEFIWNPLSELGVDTLFAFGKPWLDACARLGLEPTQRWGSGGTDFGSSVASRAFVAYDVPSGQRLIVAWQQGYAGPPDRDDTLRMRFAVGA